jgi:hypothetical protein
MADQPPSDAGAPRWVKIFGLVALALVALFVALHLTGLAPRGHGGHTPPAGADHGAHRP